MQRPTFSKPRRSLRGVGGLIPGDGLALRDPSLPTPTLDKITQEQIGRVLRAMYADLERQPVPQRLLELVRKIEQPKG